MSLSDGNPLACTIVSDKKLGVPRAQRVCLRTRTSDILFGGPGLMPRSKRALSSRCDPRYLALSEGRDLGCAWEQDGKSSFSLVLRGPIRPDKYLRHRTNPVVETRERRGPSVTAGTMALSTASAGLFLVSGLVVAVTLKRTFFHTWRSSVAVVTVVMIWICWALVIGQLLGAFGWLRRGPLVIAALACAGLALVMFRHLPPLAREPNEGGAGRPDGAAPR